MACQADPEFGLPGYFSPLCVERTYIMKSQLLDLQRNLDRHNEFAPYIKAREGILSLGAVDRGGRECFLKMKAVFFEEFLASFSTHVESIWLSNKTLIYIIRGSPILAKWFLRWLFFHEDNIRHDDHGNDRADFPWTDEWTEFEGHGTSGKKKHRSILQIACDTSRLEPMPMRFSAIQY